MSKADVEWVGPSAYAKHRAVNLSTVKDWIKEGKLDGAVKKGSNNRNKIDLKKADAILDGKVDDSVSEEIEPTASNQGSLTKMRTAKTAVEAKTANLKYQKLAGQLVDRQEVVNVAKQMGIMTKEALLNLPDRLSPVLASETEIDEINHILTEAINEALRNLALGNWEFFKDDKDGTE